MKFNLTVSQYKVISDLALRLDGDKIILMEDGDLDIIKGCVSLASIYMNDDHPIVVIHKDDIPLSYSKEANRLLGCSSELLEYMFPNI